MARSPVSVKIVLCPTKCVVASYLFSSAKTGSERLARVQLLRGRRILGVHVHDEVGVFGKESHLTFRIATIGAVCVSLDELADGEAIRGFFGGDGDVFAHERASLGLKNGAGFEKRLDPVPAIFAADAGVFESAPGRLRIIRHAVDHHTPGPDL